MCLFSIIDLPHLGLQLNIVDTPGLFDPGLSNGETISEIGKSLSLVPGGVLHAALIVLNGDDVRFTAEEQVLIKLFIFIFISLLGVNFSNLGL